MESKDKEGRDGMGGIEERGAAAYGKLVEMAKAEAEAEARRFFTLNDAEQFESLQASLFQLIMDREFLFILDGGKDKVPARMLKDTIGAMARSAAAAAGEEERAWAERRMAAAGKAEPPEKDSEKAEKAEKDEKAEKAEKDEKDEKDANDGAKTRRLRLLGQMKRGLDMAFATRDRVGGRKADLSLLMREVAEKLAADPDDRSVWQGPDDETLRLMYSNTVNMLLLARHRWE